MSEEALRQFIERLNQDSSFRESVEADPENAFAEFALSPAEQVALASGDEDALRRLAGTDVSGYWIMQSVHYACPRPRPANTPGSGSGWGDAEAGNGGSGNAEARNGGT